MHMQAVGIRQSAWRNILGPLTTIAAVAAIYLSDRYLVRVPNPGALYYLAVVFSAYLGGLGPALASAAISLGYVALTFSESDALFHYQPESLSRLLVLFVGIPATALMAGVLHARARHSLERERGLRARVEERNRELETLRSALDHVDVGIVLLDRELRAQFINRAFRRIWRLPDQLADRKPAFVGLMYHGRDHGAFEVPPGQLAAYVAQRTASVRAGDERPIDVRLAGGDVRRVRCKVLPDGGRMLTYGNVSDIVHHSDQLEELAAHDPLTGLYNRREFLRLGEAELALFHRQGRPLAVLMLDIDLFKSINDRHGHDVGDRAIIAVANWCMQAKRSSDLVARLGGEELALLLPGTGIDDALEFAERLRQSIAERVVVHGHATIRMTVSIGASAAHEQTDSIADLVKQADIALYEAKRAGRNRVQAWSAAAGRPATAA